MAFTSPSLGPITFEGMFEDIRRYVSQVPDARYRLIVGTDSQLREGRGVQFVTAVVVHRLGKGARYYYQREEQRHMRSLRQRILYETSLSLAVAARLAERLAEAHLPELDLEVHLDVGPNGDTRELIREIVGMVVGSGFQAKIKPESFGASTVADRYTKAASRLG
ncbi:MAG: ribonuclease H-like YkuK family protein [Clostridia bacterium]|nr:ribonuclease H-like YkuK family protein [Clostridia bacterium]